MRGDGPAADRALALHPAVERAAGRLRRAVPATLTAASEVAEDLGLAAPSPDPATSHAAAPESASGQAPAGSEHATRAEVARLLQIADLIQADPRPEPAWLEPGRLGLISDLVAEAARQYERAVASRTASVT